MAAERKRERDRGGGKARRCFEVHACRAGAREAELKKRWPYALKLCLPLKRVFRSHYIKSRQCW